MALLEVENIDVFYGPIQALRGVTLHVDTGEKVALVGANGAGKTTTLRTISGLLSPTSGTITFDGKAIGGLPAQQVTGLGIAHLPEGRDLFASLPVVENLKLGYWTKRKDKAGLQARIDRVMDYFPILRERADQAAGTLSGGEQQMLGVARALMSSPKLLIVDELSLGLAPLIVSQLFEILEEVNKEGTAVLLVEQFVHLALQHTTRAYVLQKGEIVIEGSSAQLADDPTLVASYLGESKQHAAQKPTPAANAKPSPAANAIPTPAANAKPTPAANAKKAPAAKKTTAAKKRPAKKKAPARRVTPL